MPTSPPNRGGWTAVIMAAVLLIATAYGGAYLWLMEPLENLMQWDSRPPEILGRFPYYTHPILERAFAPAHWLDRRIRPEFWESPP